MLSVAKQLMTHARSPDGPRNSIRLVAAAFLAK